MEAHTFFLQLMVILVAARVFAEAAARLQTPPVIGELTAGIVLGPSVLGWIEPSEVLRMLAEIGIILLLFRVGLETDVRQLVRAGAKSTVVAVSGFVLPFVLGYGVTRGIFGMPILTSLFIGGTLTATSIGITVRVLSDLGRQNAKEGRIVLGAAVIDDIFGVVLLALLYEFSVGGGVSLINAGKVMAFILIFFMLATPAAKIMSLLIYKFDSAPHIPGMIPTMVVALVLLFAWLSHLVGAPELLGGFAAGLALSRRFFLPFGVAIRKAPGFARRTEDQMRPIVQLFTPIFFVMVGLSLNLREVDWSSATIWILSLGLLAAAVVGKLVAGFLIPEPWATRWAIGLAMVPRGEVGLIFAELGRVAGVFDNQTYAAMIIVIAFTTLLVPVALKVFYGRYGTRMESTGPPEVTARLAKTPGAYHNDSQGGDRTRGTGRPVKGGR